MKRTWKLLEAQVTLHGGYTVVVEYTTHPGWVRRLLNRYARPVSEVRSYRGMGAMWYEQGTWRRAEPYEIVICALAVKTMENEHLIQLVP